MRILIHPRSLTVDTDLRTRTEIALGAGLESIKPYVHSLDAYLTDVNGPRGGPDKRCRIVAQTPTGPVIVSRMDRDPVAASVAAAAKCRRVVSDRLKRQRDRRRRVAA